MSKVAFGLGVVCVINALNTGTLAIARQMRGDYVVATAMACCFVINVSIVFLQAQIMEHSS